MMGFYEKDKGERIKGEFEINGCVMMLNGGRIIISYIPFIISF